MKVKELINELNKLDPNLEVLLSSDEEGNSYSSIYKLKLAKFDISHRSTYVVGEVVFTENLFDLEEDVEKVCTTEKIVVIYPY